MKTLRRSRVAGSRTPWEQLCGDGFTASAEGFVLLIDNDGRLVVAAPQWHRRFRGWWQWDEGMRWRDVAPEAGADDAWEEWSNLIRAARDTENPFQTSVTLRRGRNDSVRIDYLSQPLRDAAGVGIGAVIAGKFVAGSATAPEPTAAENFGAAQATGIMTALWVRAKRRKGESGFFIEAVSAGARKLIGAGTLRVGMEFPECLPPELRELGSGLLEKAVSDGEPATGNVENATPDGRGLPDLELTVFPAPAGRFCVVLRRTAARTAGRRMLVTCGEQIVSLEGELRRAQRLATQGMLAAAIGHEVNNCLGIALANASLFREQHASLAEAARAIEPVIHAVQTAGKICQRFRNLGGKLEAAPDLIDLGTTVQRGFDMLVRIVPRRLTFEPAANVALPIRADPTHIEQIVVNLVLNARDATREGTGRITLAVGRTVATDGSKAIHWLQVEDDGAGIPIDVQRKLFTAYFTTKPNRRGTGLGLATVLRLTKAMGGDVRLTSGVGRGTSVRIMLPAAEAASAA